MILAEKMIRLRKKNGWTQEELAEKCDVSRQAVAKWEGAQTVPGLDKILQLSALFGVSTDYLLKDEMEDEEFVEGDADTDRKHVTLEEANAFLEWRKTAAVRIACATFLCVLSVIPLLTLGASATLLPLGISESLAAGVGVVALLVMVAAAVAIFIRCGFQNEPYAYLDQGNFVAEYGVEGMVRERQAAYKSTYARSNIIGACVCIVSPIPLLAGAFMEREFLTVMMLIATILLAGIGAMFFIIAGVRWASMQKLLKEGEFRLKDKRRTKVKEGVATIYWLTATAVYLGWSFLTDNWEESWIVWPIAGVAFAGVMAACNLLIKDEQ